MEITENYKFKLPSKGVREWHIFLNENFKKTETELVKFNENLKVIEAKANSIIADAGDSNTEIVDGRIGTDGVARETIGELIREIDSLTRKNQYSRLISENDAVNHMAGRSREVEDVKAESGKAVDVIIDGSGSYIAVEAIADNLRKCQYTAAIRLRTTDDQTIDAELMKIKVECYDDTLVNPDFTEIASRTIKATEFESTDDYEIKYIPFNFKVGNKIRVLIETTNLKQFFVDSIMIFPATAPIGV